MTASGDRKARRSPVWRAVVMALGGAVCLLGVAAAQATPDAAPTPTPSPAESATHAQRAQEEITVTARRREENVQDVPIAVTVVPGEELADRQASDISVLQGEVPNLALFAARNQSTTLTVFLRGIGQGDALWGVDPGVGLYLDDVYVARPQAALLDVYDVQRIEVLRGPQGTLYGKNTIGGAVKYVSTPPPDHLQARVALTGGSFDERDVRASLGGAMAGGKLRGKLAVARLVHDGYGHNLFTGRDVSDKDTLAYRGALDFLASDRLQVRLSLDHSRDEAQPKGHTRLRANPFCLQPAFGGTGEPCPPEDHVFDTRSGLEPRNGARATGGAVTVDLAASPVWKLRSITGYRQTDSENNIDFDTTPGTIADVVGTLFDHQVSEELQGLYAKGAWSGILGLYYFRGVAGGVVKNDFFGRSFTTNDGETWTKSMALYGDASYLVTDRLTCEIGLRATRERKETVARNATYLDPAFTRFLRFEADFDQSKTFDSLAPRLAVDYRLTDDVLAYASASRGFKSGGFNIRAQARVLPRTAEPFDDEVLDVAELGLKSSLLGHRLTLDLATFYGEYRDIQVSTFTAYDSDGDGVDDAFLGDFLNAGDATMAGVELEYDYRLPLQWLGLSGQIGYLHADPRGIIDNNHNGLPDTQPITNAPAWTGSLHLDVDLPAWGGALGGSVGAAYRDDAILTNEGELNDQPLPPISQRAYTLLDAYVSWLSPGGSWRFGIAGRNLTDEHYLTSGYNVPALGILLGSYGDPRTITATMEYRIE